MNVTCPQCATVFRVDPAKVPERGVRARCSVCAGLIAVRRPPVAAPASPRQAMPAMAPVEAPVMRSMPTPPVAVAPPPPPSPPMVASVVAAVEPPPPVPPPVVETPVVVVPTPEPERVAMPASPPAVPIAALPQNPPHAPEPTAAAAPQGAFTNPFLQQDPGTRARRLARALISDLVVYHPEKRQRGLADGNLKELFAEEIRKSWEEYTEQVGEEIASSTAFFTDALNEILSEGRQLFG